MKALILASSAQGASADLARPIAGAPLLVRQLELLRANGVSRAVVNRVATHPLPSFLSAEALGATGVKVTWIPSSEPLSAADLARRAGLNDARVIVLPHAVVGDLPLRATTPSDAREPSLDGSPGWLAKVDSEEAAHALTCEVLAGRRSGVEVRGSELSPGIWSCRGAIIEDGALLEAPCYLGPGCFVAAGARLGPGAILEEGAVALRGSVVTNARVTAGVVIGQGVVIEHALLSGTSLEPHRGQAVAIDDDLLVGRRRSRHLVSRAAAAATYAVLAPAAVAAGGSAMRSLRRLARVVDGSGAWIGVRESESDPVVIDVGALLVPPDAQDVERAAARSLYRAKKSTLLDAKLLLGLLVGAGSPS
jgi:carbonic anhydrase/acetyltransferase-like protein (isoleucine patch superfamily)